jgi:CheY-like chemotaxis protein
MINQKKFNKKVLVVDDEEKIREILTRTLSVRDYECFEAGNGLAALEILKKYHNDVFLVILDLSMPQMGGIEFLKKCKKKYPEIEIIILTGFGEDNDINEALNHDISYFCSKPIELKELLFITEKTKERYQIKMYNKFLMHKLKKSEVDQLVKNEYVLVAEELKKSLIKKSVVIDKLIEFIQKKNIKIPDELRNLIIDSDIIDDKDNYEVM